MNIQEQIISIIIKVLKNDKLILEAHYSAADVAGWDSLHHVMIIAEIEKQFDIKFDFMEVMDLKTIDDLSKAVERKR